jgi:hypothetical protein
MVKRNEKGEILFDFKALMDHKPKTKIILTRKNEPNIDRMAEAFYKLLKK